MIAGLAVYLISLPRSTKRRAEMETKLAEIGLEFEWFQAVDGKANWTSLQSDVDLAAFRRNTGREVMPGETGCYHSHLAVWRRFLDSDADVALVLEDDVVFHNDFLTALGLAMSARDRWDLLKLNKIRAKHAFRQSNLPPYYLNAYLGAATGTGAYMITRDLAARLLPSMVPITRPIDHELDRTHLHDFRHLGLEPFPSHVDDGNESTITGTGFSEVKKFSTWKRLPNYLLRLDNLIRKTVHMGRKRMLF